MVGALLLSAYVGGIGAQDTATVHASHVNTSKVCWRGKPLPACDQFLITEYGHYFRLLRPTHTISVTENTLLGQEDRVRRVPPILGTFEIGGMKNVRKNSALGLSYVVGIDELRGDVPKTSHGVKLRYRRWVGLSGNSVDVGVGVESRPEPGFGEPLQRSSGLTSDLAVNARDYLALLVRYDLMRLDGRLKSELAVGVRSGAQIGFWGALGTVVVCHAAARV